MKRAFFLVICIVLLLHGGFPARGQADTARKVRRPVTDSTWSQWNVRLAPYVWVLGIKGQIAITPDPVQLPDLPPPVEQLPSGKNIYDIDLSPREVANSLKFALMLSGQFHITRFVTQFNISSIVLESTFEAPFNWAFQDNLIRLAYAGGDLGFGYRVIQERKFEFDVLLGLKFVYSKVEISTDLTGAYPVNTAIDRFWTDPVLATNFSYRPHKRIELAAYGDIGSTLVNDNLTWQFSFHANVLITRIFYISAGYRQYYLNFSAREAFCSGSLQGAIVKFAFQF